MTATTTVSAADLLASKPEGAVKALIAVFESDNCDLMTDYFSTKTERTVFLGWSKSNRDSFAEMRKAAARFAETAPLATAGKDAEHREKYSMGRGYYLKASGCYSTGWLVKKTGDWWFDRKTTVEALNGAFAIGAGLHGSGVAPVAA
jgi:hypothetical protein